ncbi:hypothetical protein HY68_36200 [Streptomyces sp. AcH 505]|nr:hypothetical protein HY68_36200 [Streptomyces sp. AcH 505]
MDQKSHSIRYLIWINSRIQQVGQLFEIAIFDGLMSRTPSVLYFYFDSRMGCSIPEVLHFRIHAPIIHQHQTCSHCLVR